MSNFNKYELTIILAFYYFEKERINDDKINKLTKKMSSFFKKDFNRQNISFAVTEFKSIDPSFNVNKIDSIDSKLMELWNYYIDADRVSDLKKVYSTFKKTDTFNMNNIIMVSDDLFDEYINHSIDDLPEYSFEDEPKPLYKNDCNKSNQPLRDVNVSLRALKFANYKCEFDSSHELFIRKNCDIPYTEGHHLVPLKFQKNFNVNLDVEANVVSLCGNCHNKLHYGKGYEEIIKELYNQRVERLKKVGIYITLDELLEMYK